MDVFRVKGFLLILLTFILVVPTECVDIDFRMLEERSPGYVVGNILQKYNADRDSLRFTLMKQGNVHESLFEVEEISGNLSTKAVIDREVLCEFVNVCEILLEVAAQTIHNDGFFDVINVKIIVDDINDNAPTFITSSINLPISEAVLIGTSLTVEGARDKDTSDLFSIQTYDLEPTTPEQSIPFRLSYVKKLDGSFSVKLIVSERLDREVKDSYQFYIVAKDGGSPKKEGRLMVNVSVTDVNDNAPEFDQPEYDISVREDANVNDVILALTAKDKDLGKNGEVRFRLSPYQQMNNLKYFSIDETQGIIRVKEKLDIDAGGNFKLIIEAIDQGDTPLTSQTFVYVTLLDTSNSAPEIQMNLLSKSNFSRVSEYANVGAVVAHVAVVDRDTGRNGDVNCSVLSDIFSLQRYDVMEYKVVVSKPLDRERIDKHMVTVHCEDKGVPPLTGTSSFIVQIDDENDNPPRFRQQRYFADINESNDIGDKITTISAFDLDAGNNSKITYFMDPTSSKYAFVNTETGDVMANKVFDKESSDGQGISLTVYAKDNGVPSLTGTTSVIVTINDINDEKPVFDQSVFRFWLDENLLADTTVGKLSATDKDKGGNAITIFSLKPGSQTVPFVVLQDGVIKTNQQLDRETQSQYSFEVVATDATNDKLFSYATVTVFLVDQNDNTPIIEYPRPGNDTVRVSYLTAPRSIIYSVIAFDLDEPNTDNSKLRFTLTTVNSTNYFSIDPSTGDIFLSAPLENTNSVGKMYILQISVSDKGEDTEPTTATLKVIITLENATAAALVEDSNKNFVIVVVVAAVTILISAGIIVTICIIRRLDTRRREEKQRQKVLSENMYTKNNEEVDNIFPLPMDTSFSEKKKKEVSFSLEEKGLHQVNLGLSPGSEDRSNDSFEQILLEPPPQYQLIVPGQGKLDDCHSDMSGESAGDSGKGGSDDDLQGPVGLGYDKDDLSRNKATWNNRCDTPPAMKPMTSFPTRYNRNNSLPHQEIIPFSFKKPPTYPSSGFKINNLSPTNSAYTVPKYYDEESHSSSGFQSVDSNSNFNITSNRSGHKISLNRGNISDCVV